MDNRITGRRLKSLLSYDLLKITAIIVGGILLWSLLFTMLGPSIEEGQRLAVYSLDVFVDSNEMNALLEGDESGYKTYDTRETTFYNFGTYGSSSAFSQQFAAWSSVGQLDFWFVSTEQKLEREDDDGEKYNTSVGETYAAYYCDLEKMVEDALDYCRNAGYDGNAFDERKIAGHFTARKKRDNFYRHGLITVDDEKERIEKIYNAADFFGSLLNSGTDIWYTLDIDGEETICGIDMGKLGALGPDESGKKAAMLCGTGKSDENSNGTADGVALTVFDNSRHQGYLFYDGLCFLSAVVADYSSL